MYENPRMAFKLLTNGEIVEVADSGTDLSGSYVYEAPENAIPVECADPSGAPSCIIVETTQGPIAVPVGATGWVFGHHHEKGPSWPCPHCTVIELPENALESDVWLRYKGKTFAKVDGETIRECLTNLEDHIDADE